jgi:solute carrier family 35, member C2
MLTVTIAMCKSSVLGFVLLFAFLFRLEKPSWKLAAIITTMTAGVIMMVAGETAFDALGFVLVMSAAASSGFRWSLTQILLLRNPATSNPFSSIFFLAPVMFLTLLVLAIPVEGPLALSHAFTALSSEKGTLLSLVILLFPGCLAFAMTASEFALLQRTSVVTLSICGIFKEVLTISTASIIFADELTPINASGLVVTIATMAYYNYTKMQAMREEARREAHIAVEQEFAPVLAATPTGAAGGSEHQDRQGRMVNGGVGNARPRANTDDLIRASLSVSVNGEQPARPRFESSTIVSPVKRPGDLE